MYFYKNPITERQDYFMEVHGFTCGCYACQMKLPTDSETCVNVFDQLNKIFVESLMKKKNMNIIFKEIVQELYKHVDYGLRRTMIEQFYQMCFMPYNLDFSLFFKNFSTLQEP